MKAPATWPAESACNTVGVGVEGTDVDRRLAGLLTNASLGSLRVLVRSTVPSSIANGLPEK